MNDCGCDIILIGGGIIGEETIEYCPMHKAALQLLEALKDALQWLENIEWAADQDGYMAITVNLEDLKEKILASKQAIALAEGNSPNNNPNLTTD